MKKSLLTITAVVATLFVSAQRIEVKEGSEKFSTGSHNAFSTTIFANTQDDVESEWKKFLKDFKNLKVKSDKGEIFADNVVIKDWGNDPVDIYTTFEEDKKTKTVYMHVAVDLGGAYANSSEHKDKAAYINKMVKEFSIKMTKAPLAEIVKNNEKILENLQEDQSNLEKKNKSLKSDIEDYKSKIAKTEQEISENESNQTTKKAAIETQKTIVNEGKNNLEKVN